MSDHFVARKGLISMKSSSFLEDVYISGSLTSVDCVMFDTTYDTASAMSMVPGMVRWNAEDGTVDIGMLNDVVQQIGQETYYYVKASGNITNGHSVMAVGSLGASGKILASSATGAIDGKYIMGVATQDITNGNFGYVTAFGLVRGLDTSAWQTGSVLYYDPTTLGGLTDILPTAPNPKVVMAMVVNSHPNNGELLVRVSAGSTLGLTDSNVEFGTLSDKDFIYYNSASGRWENGSLVSIGTTSSYSNTASYALTASYVAQSSYFMSIHTASQAIATTNTYQEVSFSLDQKNNGWIHPSNSGRFTASYSGEYVVTTTLSVQKTGTGTQTLAMRMLYNGQEVTGSYASLPMTVNNVQNQLTSHAVFSISSGSGFIVQMASTSTNMSLQPPTLIGTSVARPSATIVINKI